MSILKKILRESLDFDSIFKMPFISVIKKNGGEVVIVGGSVRDKFLGKDSKDIDLLCRGIDMNKLISILEKYGRTDLVGKSFGVIKFIPDGYDLDEPIDIALPRTERPLTDFEKDEAEKKTGKRPKGYQAFTTDSDHNLSIKDDLLRRDFTINASTVTSDGDLYDPFNGKEDLDNKIIRMVSPQSFSDDPLRILRGIQFASRFGFKIEKNTWEEMKKNASKIRDISGERILIELEKIIKKGDPMIGFKLLMDSGVYDVIFGTHFTKFIGDVSLIKKSKTLSEFIYSIVQDSVKDISKIHIERLRGTIDTAREIDCLELAWNNKNTSILNSRLTAYKIYKTTVKGFNLQLYPSNISKAINDLKSKYPKSMSELEINGNDLMELGLRGKEIAEAFNNIFIEIYSDKLKNKKIDIINYLKKTNK